ncbi:MAG: restriction endonuclease [Roseibium sp.]|uniref:restriction endonuclease n=1 Tax=Roseibium sp. TaxID=1936156 RepID=UPI003296E9BB
MSPKETRQLWLFRPGRTAAVEAAALEEAILCPDFGIRQDLSDHHDKEMIYQEVVEAHPGEKSKRLDTITTQLDLLLNGIQPGDLVISPMPRAGTISIGMITPGYASSSEGWAGRNVNWLASGLPKDAFLPDLLHSMGALQRICRISRNDALPRIEAVLQTGRDPGPTGSNSVGMPDSLDDLEAMLTSRIMARIGSTFAGHEMADLVAAVLGIDGYRSRISPPGPDGGVDILSGRGITGLDGSTLTVQVKSGDIVADHPTLQQLIGAMSTNGSDAGLLVSWGGVTRSVRAKLDEMWFKVRVWDAHDLTQAIMEGYDDLPLHIRDRIGLRKIWAC